MAKKWYLINTYSGHEHKVRTNILKKLEAMGMKNFLDKDDILVPERKRYEFKETKNGRVVKEVYEKIYPTYVFIRMEIVDEILFTISNTPGIASFLKVQGEKNQPQEVSDEEIAHIMSILEANKHLRPLNDFRVDDKVRILNNTLQGREGTIKAFSEDKTIAKVELEGFENIRSIDIQVSDLIRIDPSLKR